MGTFFGLPDEFVSPQAAALRIVALSTRAEREAYWLRIPEGWRVPIGHLAKIGIGQAIAELPELEQRRKALDEVPEIWLEDVRWHVRRLYNTREVRAEYQRELASGRA